MIQLFAYSQSDESQFFTELDAVESNIELMFQVEDLADITARRAPHSLNFDLPMTDTNNKFFGHYYNANVQVGTWSPFVKTKVEIRDQGIRLFAGTLQLLNVDTYNKNYSVAVASSVADLFSALKGKSWAEVLGGTLDHTLSDANVIDSFDTANDITSGAVGAGTVVYPLCDLGNYQGIGWNFRFGAYGINGVGEIELHRLRPAVKVRYLFEAICTYAGFSITSDFFDTDRFNKLYMLVGSKKESLALRNVQGAKVGRSTPLTVSPNTATDLAFSLETGSFYDPDNVFSGGVFSAFGTGVFQFQFQIDLLQAVYTGTYTAQILAVSNSNTWTFQTTGDYQVQNSVTWTWNLQLSQGQSVTFYLLHNGANSLTVQTSSYIALTAYDIGGAGAVVDMPLNLLDCTVDKWLKEIVFRFNLSFIELDYEHELQVEPYMDLLAAGTTTKDWTNKIDISQPVVIKPPTEYQKRRRIFQDAEGKDYKNRRTQESAFSTTGNRPYGVQAVLNDNEFVFEEEEYTSLFTPLRIRAVQGENYSYSNPSNMLVPVLYDEETVDGELQRKTALQQPWLGYYNGTENIDANDATATINIGASTSTVYPLFSCYDSLPVTASSYSILWGVTGADEKNNALIDASTPTSLSVYNVYHKPYLQAIEDANARVMECSALLSPGDVSALRWNDKIWVRDSYWRVINMSNYSVGDTRPVRLTLLKDIVGAPSGCALTLDSYNVNGTTNWVDDSGTPATPTQRCCEAAGLQWNPSNNSCVWFTGTHGTDDGSPVTPTDTNPDDGGIVPPSGTTNVKANFNNLSIVQQQFPAMVESTGSGWYALQAAGNVTQFALKSNNIYNIQVNVTGVEKTATGTFGYKAIGSFSMAIDYTTTSPRAIGTVQTVSATGDWTISMQPSVTGTTAAEIAFQVAGVTAKDITYSAVINVLTTNVANKYIPILAGDALYQNGDYIQYQNGDEMLWNG